MKRSLIMVSILLLWAAPVFGGFMDFSGNGFDHRGPGPHGWGFWGGDLHGFGWGWGPCWGIWGCGSVDRIELREERYEDRYDTLVEKYDTGVAENPDFAGSDEYDHLLTSFERLVDRHDLFLDRVTETIDCVGELIDKTNERIQQYDDLLANPPERIPEECVDNFTERITDKKERAETWLDKLTTKQTTLQDDHDQYVAFHDELVAYVDQITAADASASTMMETSLETVSLSGDSLAVEGLQVGESLRGAAWEDVSLPSVAKPFESSAGLDSACTLYNWDLSLVAPAPVPEPSTVLLAVCGVIAAMGLVGFRRLKAS